MCKVPVVEMDTKRLLIHNASHNKPSGFCMQKAAVATV